ncbi:membrane-spanning 4-domains subfamily A member 13-like [Heterocephalus glaber]|uniref:Membrane-spanning 4-domains subfamily A member 13-like n=1 Tax=Heterocephalus glaber TaxID=10181 RepID=A0AAX6S5X2_HETGA|nr:membrane-spanning 4-domains subfamily A member 13-like [Heterocephalus glaber]
MACGSAQISRADSFILGTIQIMLGIFNVLMWYFLLVLYMGQIKGVFGKYEPLTYKTGCTLWGAKLGREVSHVLLIVYHLEVSIDLTHANFMCGSLRQRHGSVSVPATEEAESAL